VEGLHFRVGLDPAVVRGLRDAARDPDGADAEALRAAYIRFEAVADHGMAIIYFLQSDLLPSLLAAGVQVIVLTDDDTKDKIAAQFAQPGLIFDGLRLKEANRYAQTVQPRWQWLLAYLRRVGGYWRINTEAMDSHIGEVWAENGWKFRLGVWIPSALGLEDALTSDPSPNG